ncbi:MAG: PEP-CTERM sorting domain-containing protein [Verrucomicrobia bacterium]|nr:PEP-CTERM sorting domain-containing protein [Verrucomicrobiota bacterium]
MISFKFFRNVFIAAILPIICISGARAQVTVLSFEGLTDMTDVRDYYNGGAGGNLGISFLTGALAVVSDQSGGTGNFDAGSSGSNVIAFVNSQSATMNVISGFSTGFSFYYAAFGPGSVAVYSGPDATGTVLGTFTLARTVFGSRILGWEMTGVSFAGTAYSVSFGGAAGSIGFDDITIGSATPGAPVPEPATYALVAGVMALAGTVVWRRRARA